MRRGGAAGVLLRGERVGARRAIMHKACTYGVNPNADARLAARVAAQSCPDFNSTQHPTQRLPLPYVVAGVIDGRNLCPIRPTFLVPQVPGFLFQSHDFPPPLSLSLPAMASPSFSLACNPPQPSARATQAPPPLAPLLTAAHLDAIHTYLMHTYSIKYTHTR